MTTTTMRKRNLIQIALTLALTSTCSVAYNVEGNTDHTVKKVETVTASVETRSHYKDAQGNFTDVDDPAIWVNPIDKSKSDYYIKKGRH